MPTYVGLYRWTDQGVKNVKDTVKRSEQARAAIEKVGGRLLSIHWTQGTYDIVAIAEYPDDETASAVNLTVAMGGSIRSETMRAFNAEEMQRVLDKIP